MTSAPPTHTASTSVAPGAGYPERTAWPLLPLPPAVVIFLGVAVAVAFGFLGVSDLAKASDEHAAGRAELLASTLGARLSQIPKGQRLEVMQLAARKTGAEFLVVSPKGDVVLDASLGPAD